MIIIVIKVLLFTEYTESRLILIEFRIIVPGFQHVEILK